MKNFDQLRSYADLLEINYGVYNEKTEICPQSDFHMDFLDLKILEIPNSFQVKKAIVMCLPTPSNKDDGSEYDYYYTLLQDLIDIEKPQYIGLDNGYVKLAMWCDWV